MSTGSAPNTTVNCLISKLLHHWTNRSWGDARPLESEGRWCLVQLAFAGLAFAGLAFAPRNPQCFTSSEDYSFIAAYFSKQN